METYRLTVNGQPHGYQRPGNLLTLELTVPPGSSRDVLIEYENDLDLGAIDIGKPSLRFKILRYFSDFRDLKLSRIPLGRNLVEMYYGDSGPGKHYRLLALVIFILGGFGYLRWRKRRRSPLQKPFDV